MIFIYEQVDNMFIWIKDEQSRQLNLFIDQGELSETRATYNLGWKVLI